MKKKIIIALLVSLVISFVSLVLFIQSFPDSTQYRENKFYSQSFASNTIFLIGSSQVAELNATLIKENLSKNHQDHMIYNLAYPSDTPIQRIKTIDKILSAKPQLIVYGFSYRDLQSEYNNKIWPDVHDIVGNFFIEHQLISADLGNPKLVTMTAIHDLSKTHKLMGPKNIQYEKDTPFYAYATSDKNIASQQELQEDPILSYIQTVHIEEPEKNQQIIALSEIIKKCKEKNIKIVFFTTPMQRLYLDNLPVSQKIVFDDTIKYLRNTLNVKVYDLTEKYSDLPIFINLSHVAHNRNAETYSNTLSNVILYEMNTNAI